MVCVTLAKVGMVNGSNVRINYRKGGLFPVVTGIEPDVRLVNFGMFVGISMFHTENGDWWNKGHSNPESARLEAGMGSMMRVCELLCDLRRGAHVRKREERYERRSTEPYYFFVSTA
uniref:Uncharacterized protein n=1 Tax=Erythrolobus madagascarensis TaxID=708628 RepID=A0A7S0XIR1_9RHOD|mmetsp:Transcript_4333/g.9406  ORF Transcript_4333/g.9406 Transcript_4333/m.9406 type:complete len:117 (+) Transcript_4333:351-701(+)